MSTQVGLRFPTLARAVGMEVALAAVCTAAVALRIPTHVVLAVAVPLALLPFVVVAGRSVHDWVATSVRFVTGARILPGETFEYMTSDGDPVGVHRRGNRVSCVLELLPTGGSTTHLSPGTATTESTLDLPSIARCLSQHDISVCGIDIVSHGSRSTSGSPATDVYESLIGPLPAVATRTVWITVSIDIRRNHGAVEARGGGHDGACRTAHIATARVARALEARGVRSTMSTRRDIQAAASHVCRGTPFESLTQNWRSAPLPGVIATGFGFDCRRADDDMLAGLWAVLALSASVVLRIAPSRARDHVDISGSCHFVTRSAPPSPPLRRVVSMGGRQRDALMSSLPLAIRPHGRTEPRAEMSYGRLGELRIPTAGCGQLLGSNSSGQGVAARIHGFDLPAVFVSGELYLAQQLVFRAIATGARVLVRTDRAHAWGPLVDSVATPDRLRIEGSPHRVGPRIDLVMHDFSDALADIPSRRADGVTVLTLAEHPDRTAMSAASLSIVQPGAAGDRIYVSTSRSEAELVLVTIPQETAFIGRPRSVRRPTAAY